MAANSTKNDSLNIKIDNKEITLNSKLIDSAELIYKYKIETSGENITNVINHFIEKKAATTKIDGFRVGKVPHNIIKNKFNQQIMQDALNLYLTECSKKIINDNNYKLATQPSINIESFDEEKLAFEIGFELLPNFEEIKFDQIELEKPIVKITEKETNEFLDKIANNNKDYINAKKDHKTEIGDVAVIDFVGRIDKKEFEGGRANDFRLELGSKSFIDNFEEQLVGLKAGESKDVKVKFPQDYHVAELAGKPATFSVTIKEILHTKTPKVDDEFAKKLKFSDLKELQEKVNQQIDMQYNQLIENKMKKDLFDLFDKKFKFAIPPSMLKSEFDLLWKQVQQVKNNDPEMKNKSDKELEKEYNDIAKRRVKLGIILSETADKLGIEVTQQDLQKEVGKQINMNPTAQKQIIDYYSKNPSAVQSLKGPILEDKVVKEILTKIKLKEKNYTIDKLKEAVNS